jgi:hypothetical protein
MNHVTLEDKRIECIAGKEHLIGPREFPRRDGIFRPLVSVFSEQSIEINSIPVKTRLFSRQFLKK